jgi:hypothetical protein
MGKIYHTQRFHLYFSYTTLPAAFAEARIKYRRPNGTTGYFVPTHDTVGKQFYYNSTTRIGDVGDWTFWGVVITTNSEEIASEPIVKYISREGY